MLSNFFYLSRNPDQFGQDSNSTQWPELKNIFDDQVKPVQGVVNYNRKWC